jgi:hypothetical protein
MYFDPGNPCTYLYDMFHSVTLYTSQPNVSLPLTFIILLLAHVFDIEYKSLVFHLGRGMVFVRYDAELVK